LSGFHVTDYDTEHSLCVFLAQALAQFRQALLEMGRPCSFPLFQSRDQNRVCSAQSLDGRYREARAMSTQAGGASSHSTVMMLPPDMSTYRVGQRFIDGTNCLQPPLFLRIREAHLDSRTIHKLEAPPCTTNQLCEITFSLGPVGRVFSRVMPSQKRFRGRQSSQLRPSRVSMSMFPEHLQSFACSPG
jgi:hypothetical protein